MREWITTNGLGGYASLTHSNQNNSKFHGLLIASLDPPTKRHLFISNVYDEIRLNDKTFYLNGPSSKYVFDIFPTFHYNLDDVKIKKTIFMQKYKNTTIIKYEINSNKDFSIIHKPTLNSRHFYDLTKENSISFKQKNFKDKVIINPSNIDNEIKIILKDSKFSQENYWNKYYYEKDLKRNDSYIDYNFHIGNFYKQISKSDEYYLIFTLEDENYSNPSKIYFSQIWNKKRLLEQANYNGKYKKLILSTDNFVVKKSDDISIVAGYHWFSDWGRDALIALPGITLVTKRFEDAKQILYSYSKYCKKGLIPNAFMERDSVAVYNTVDASLWFIDRIYQYLKYTNDLDFVNEIWKTLDSIIDGYMNGTDFDIIMDDDFLISHGEGLTWMDVKLGDYYPTPRSKKAVEIQALWYNALKIMGNLANILGKNEIYLEIAEKVKNSFLNQYDEQYDVVDTKDLSCRPNKIFLVSVDFPMIDERFQEEIVTDVSENLLTIFGLRTLSSDNSKYIGTYLNYYNRDIAYHNGTVWPWLMGPFITAFVKVKKYDLKWRKYAFDNFLKPMFDVFGDSWDGSIYEIFDGDPPYMPNGCINQAWSVAEILRCLIEDIDYINPKYKDVFLHKIRV